MRTIPTARTPDPRAAPALRWGVLGTGWIAEKFAIALQRNTTQQVYAVGSRSRVGAQAFAARVGAPTAYGSYEALVSDPRVDVVYVATPHNYHHAHGLLAIAAGKPVLIEKPIAVSAQQAGELAAAATAAGVLCMEAFWTLFLPKYDVLGQLVGDLGVDTVLADMGECFPPEHRIFDARLAGGPLFDMGTYPLSLALWALGDPASISAYGAPTDQGGYGEINGALSIAMQATGGGLASLYTSIVAATPTTATLAGPGHTIVIDGPFYQPGGFTVTTPDGARVRYDEEPVAHEGGLHFQAAAVARHVAAGELGSAIRPMSDAVRLLRVMDEVRRQVGIALPL
ncbi:MAG: Gfo/Idh/MocA family oxidoreductase [Nostocoides sp.]